MYSPITGKENPYELQHQGALRSGEIALIDQALQNLDRSPGVSVEVKLGDEKGLYTLTITREDNRFFKKS